MKCLVTGGAGFIGSHISRKLLEKGHDVTVYDNLSVGRKDNVPVGAKFVEGDILDRDKLGDVMQGIDIVFHEAAFVSIRNSFLKPRLEFETNVIGTINLLDAMVESGVSKIVFASSMAVYGECNGGIACEGDIVQPISPYGLSKLRGEMLCKIYAERFGISYNALRYFNVFGDGQQYSEYVGVLTAFINLAQSGKPITVYGNGLQERDFIFVEDVVGANILSMNNLNNKVYNVGSGTKTSVISIAETVSREYGNSKIVHMPKPPGEIDTICANVSLARTELGFAASCGVLQYIPILCASYKCSGRRI